MRRRPKVSPISDLEGYLRLSLKKKAKEKDFQRRRNGIRSANDDGSHRLRQRHG